MGRRVPEMPCLPGRRVPWADPVGTRRHSARQTRVRMLHPATGPTIPARLGPLDA